MDDLADDSDMRSAGSRGDWRNLGDVNVNLNQTTQRQYNIPSNNYSQNSSSVAYSTFGSNS